MTITGDAGIYEVWTNDQDGRRGLGETCATAYELRVFDNLMRLEGDSRYGDLMERTIYNALFAAQSPDGRRLRYYTPFEGDREYFDKDGYCCPNNFRRIVAELPTMVYYRSGAGVAVNLYTPSEATVDLNNGVALKIRQGTDYPSSGHVVIRLDPSKPAEFPLQMRIPRWCEQVRVEVNDHPWAPLILPGKFFTLRRQWRAGDRVTLDMPMTWRMVLGRKRQSGAPPLCGAP